MNGIIENDALEKVAALLGEWLKVPKDEVRIDSELSGPDSRIDATICVGIFKFSVELKSISNTAQISSAIKALKQADSTHKGTIIPLVVVPFMGEVGRKLCDIDAPQVLKNILVG